MTKAKGNKRKIERKKNYVKGRYGDRRKETGPFNRVERMLIKFHIIPDKILARVLESSTNGIQAMRWRIKNDYNKNS